MSRGAIVLMYHAIGAPGEPASRFVVPVRRFERQLRLLVRLGYRVLPLQELVQTLQARQLPKRALSITLDDGYRDTRTLAYPVLERLGLPATIFVVSRCERNDWGRDPATGGRPLLSPADLREMVPLVTVGAHTRTHRPLTAVDPAELDDETGGSRRDLEEALGRPVALFAYPYGRFNSEACLAVERAGFLGAFTVIPGRIGVNADRFALNRIEVYGTFTLFRFLLTLWLGDTRILERWRAWRRRGTPPVAPRVVG